MNNLSMKLLFASDLLSNLMLLKLKAEGQTIQTENSPEKYKTEI